MIEDKRKLKEDLDKANEKIKAQDKEKAGKYYFLSPDYLIENYESIALITYIPSATSHLLTPMW